MPDLLNTGRHRRMTDVGPFLCAVVVVVICVLEGSLVQGFNVDTAAPIFYTNNDVKSDFGFTLALHHGVTENTLLVGAPRAQSAAFGPNTGVERSGALFSCEIDIASTNASACTEIVLDGGQPPPQADATSTPTSNSSWQWLGSTLGVGPEGTVVVCNPLHQSYHYGIYGEWRHASGGCYIITADDLTEIDHTSSSSTVQALSYSPCLEDGYYRSCLFASSVAVSEDEIIAGATNFCTRRGSVRRADHSGTYISTSPPCPSFYSGDSYLGHAVAVINIDHNDEDRFGIVASAPRMNEVNGQVIIYDSVNNEEFWWAGDPDKGTYYGHALAVSDLNNDGRDDLVVGAPMYSDASKSAENGWEAGKIFIYYNIQNDNGHADTSDSAIGPGPGCRFGYSVAALGDINGDGFNDLAVAAPFCGIGSGMEAGEDGQIFIYHGVGNGEPLRLSAKQILHPSDLGRPLKYFGSALEAGSDLDDNGFPDLVIGAYRSQTVAILRSRPIVSIEMASVSSDKTGLDVDVTDVVTPSGVLTTGFNVSVCFEYSGKGLSDNLGFSYEIVLDSSRQLVNRRAVFVTTDQPLVSAETELTHGLATCIPHPAYVLPSIRDRQTPITLSVTYQLKEGALQQNSVAPILSDTVNPIITSSIPFLRQCAGTICYPDLAVRANVTRSELVIGKEESVSLTIEVENDGEDAFLSVLEIQEPEGVFFVDVQRPVGGSIISCSYQSSTRTRACDIGNPVHAGDQIMFGLEYQTATYSAFSGEVDFNITVNSIDAEMAGREFDNQARPTIRVVAVANVSIQSSSSQERLTIERDNFLPDRNRSTEDSIGPLLSQLVSVQNAGPSFIGSALIEILLPIRLHNGDRLLNVTKVTMETDVTCDMSTRLNNESQETIEETLSDNNQTIRTLLADCGSLAECLVISCPVTRLGPGGSVAITVSSRVVSDSLLTEELFIDFVDFRSSVSGQVQGSVYPADISYFPHPEFQPLTVQSLIQLTAATPRIIVKPVPAWVYIVSSIGGLLVLVILVVVMAKLGLFKRNRLTPEKKEAIRKSIYIASMYIEGGDDEADGDDDDGDEEETPAADAGEAGVFNNEMERGGSRRDLIAQ